MPKGVFIGHTRTMSLLPRSDYLSPLYRNCLFRSSERVEAHNHVSQELVEHTLRWRRGVPDAAMFKGELSQIKMYLLRYGAEVEVAPRPFDDFVLMHTSLTGGAEIEVDGQRIEVGEGRTAMLAPRRRVRLRWYAGTHQLIIKVPHALMQSGSGHDEPGAIGLAPAFLLKRGLSSQWALLTRSLLNAMSMPSDMGLRDAWLEHFERNIALFLLAHQPADALPLPPVALGSVDTAAVDSGKPRLDGLINYIDARLGAPITLEDLARAAGVGTRTLNELCRRHLGATPMELLRNRRLDAARARLRVDPGASVTEIAYYCGFGNLGRFAHSYQERFHEFPSETLAAARTED